MAISKKKIKLIQKTSSTFLWISVALMILSTIALYFYVRNLLKSEIEEELYSTKARIENSLMKNDAVYALPPVIEIKKTSKIGIEKLKDTIIYDPSQNEMEEFRELASYSEINGNYYKITVRSLVVETRNILMAIIISYFIIIIFVFVFLFYFNKAGNQKLWLPFFTNLGQMKRFSLGSEKPIHLVESSILEFSELNTVILTLTNKVNADYRNLKQYTEDVSHELQTPLAIIQAKIENIINSDNLNAKQYEHLTSIQKDIQRLTQLNKRLSLLTKLENRQFTNPEELFLNSIIRARIDNFKELFPTKIELLEQGQVRLKMDPYLLDILCDNLISNALRHTIANGLIKVIIDPQNLTVTNPGNAALQHPEKLFTRFYGEAKAKKSMGLGLAIVQKICNLYDFAPSYSFEEKQHIFKIRFYIDKSGTPI
ncbi:MAG: HAMP domain-containing histidine kinase [Maribacter sp.]|nr:HAMP domain-containing histidine kinase [Maribacter sp.]